MLKMWAYWKVKVSWFVYWYATIQIVFTAIDATWTIPLILYSCGLYYICDYYQTTISFSSTQEDNYTFLNQLLPIKKREYCIAQSRFVSVFVLGNILLFSLVGFLQSNAIEYMKVKVFLVLSITLIYVIFHVRQVWLKTKVELKGDTRMFLCLSMIFFIIISLFLQNSLMFNLDGSFGVWLAFVVSCSFAMILLGQFIVQIRKKIQHKDHFQVNMKHPRSSIMKLAHLRYGGKVEVGSAIGVVSTIVNLYYYSIELNVLVIGLISIFVFVTIGVSLFIKIYDTNHYLKLLPITRQDIFKYTVQTWFLRWFITSVAITAIYCGLVVFRGGGFNLVLTSGDFLFLIMIHALTLFLLVKGYFSSTRGTIVCIAIVIGIVIALCTPQILNLLNQYTFVSSIVMGILLVCGTHLTSLKYKGQIFK